jgi:uncharacterized membrane protein
MQPVSMTRLLAPLAAACLISLLALCLAWEIWLAPLRPGGSWLLLKALPLLFPLRGVLHARDYTFKWAALLMLPYFTEGVVRAYSDTGFSAGLALLEAVLATLFFACAFFYVRRPRA